MKYALAFALWILSSTVLFADEVSEVSRDKAMKARSSWAAFECSILSIRADDQIEAERFLQIAMRDGREFIAAVQQKQIPLEAINKVAPVGFLLGLGGPSADFMLGRIYEAAASNLEKDFPSTGGDELREMEALNGLQERNCMLLR